MNRNPSSSVRVVSAAQAAELIKQAQIVAGRPSRQFTLLDGQQSDFDIAYDGYGLTVAGALVDAEVDEAARAGKLYTRVLN